MAKLHELLAVSSNLEGQGTTTLSELKSTFEKKRHLFEEKRKTFTPNTEGASAVTEEQSDIQTTVGQEIHWISNILSKTIDVGHQIDVANTQAKADIVTEDGTTILKEVPATSLLQLEKRLLHVLELIKSVPTLDPAKGFRPDDQRGKGIYKAREITKPRTKKENKVVVLYPHSDKHPAQTQLVTEDMPVGTIQEVEWSALISPALKADLLERCEVLMRAVKKARARANELDIDVASQKIGKKLLEHIFEPLTK